MKQPSYEQALHRLASYCSHAERCTYDIRKKLDLWEISINDQTKIIHRLQKEKFLDDSRYCRAFVNDKSKFSKWGAQKIKFALLKKNISASLINEALQEINPAESREQLYSLLKKKKDSVKGKNEYEIRQKLIRFAMGRGFHMEDIEAVLSGLTS